MAAITQAICGVLLLHMDTTSPSQASNTKSRIFFSIPNQLKSIDIDKLIFVTANCEGGVP